MLAVQISTTGDASVLESVEVDDPKPGPGEILVEVGAAGVNFIDTYQRSGLYAMPLPAILGLEGAGTVVGVGDGVGRLRVGDRVAWGTNLGSYAELVTMPADRAVRVPDGVEIDVAAALPLQGMTAHYLAVDTFPIRSGHRCLIHAGAGGVGLLLVQIAKRLGAEVFTTVGTPEKATLASAAGADHTILYREVDFAEAIRELAGDRPLDVVYDGVGASVFEPSLGLLARRGTMVTFGNASGPVDPVSPLVLSQQGSLYLTRPTLFDYVATTEDLDRRAADLFAWHLADELDVRIGARHPLAAAADAHRELEGRLTSGKVVLIP